MKPTRVETTTAHTLAEAIRSGQVTAMDTLEALLARIDRYNPALNAIVTLDVTSARRRALEADMALSRGEVWGPLHGVPITIKDSFETAGMRTTSGYPPFANRVPASDAPPVACLRKAGAIILGKTNLPTLASGIQCNNPVFGRTNNPWDLQRTPGGSSGGAAAAVAAGLTYLDLGSDIGGSIRQPAHFCGVYGLKTTGGRVIGKGHIASPRPLKLLAGWEPLLQLASFGPLARSVEDLRLCLPLIAAPNTPPLEQVPVRALSDLRIAWTDDFGGAPLDADSRRVMADFAETLMRAGCKVMRITRPNFDFEDAWNLSGQCLGTINTLFQSPLSQWLRRLASPVLSSVAGRHPLMRGLYAGMSLNAAKVGDALTQREILIEQLERFLGDWDVWICPTFPSPAFTHRATTAPVEVDEARLSQILANLLHSIIFNVTGSPVVVIPVGQSVSRLPIGIQVVGRRWQELALLNVVEQIAALTPGYQVPPGYRD